MVLRAIGNNRSIVFDHSDQRKIWIDTYQRIVLGGSTWWGRSNIISPTMRHARIRSRCWPTLQRRRRPSSSSPPQSSCPGAGWIDARYRHAQGQRQRSVACL